MKIEKPIEQGSPLSAMRPLIARAAEGEPEALTEVKGMIRADKQLATQFGDVLGDLEAETENTIFQTYFTELLGVCAREKMNSLRRELSKPNQTAIEERLVARAVLCWLHLHAVEMSYFAHIQEGSMGIEGAEHSQKNIDRAQKRYLDALRTLAVVRRLQRPQVKMTDPERGRFESLPMEVLTQERIEH